MHILEFTETWVYNALQDHFELASPTILGFRQLKTKKIKYIFENHVDL